MDGVLLRKGVHFIGMWRTSRLDDDLSREIARKSRHVNSQPADLEICTVGMRITTRVGTRESVLRMLRVNDVIINRYDPTCLMCVIKEARKLCVVVCCCYSPRDSSDIVKSFRASKRDIRIPENEVESRRIYDNEVDKGRHLVPQYRQVRAGWSRPGERSTRPHQGVPRPRLGAVCHVGVQATVGDPDYVSLSTSSLPNSDLREELIHLSEEVNAIKLLIEKSTGLFDDQKKTKPRASLKADTTVPHPIREVTPKSREKPTIVRGEFVSARSPGYLSDDVTEVQTDSRGLLDERRNSGDALDSGVLSYSGITDSMAEPNGDRIIYNNGLEVLNDVKYKGSDSSDLEDPSSHFGNTRLTTYITAPPGFQPQPVPVRTRAYTTPGRRYRRQSRNIILSSTVPRCIEDVYRSTRSSRGRSNRYSRQIVTPEVFSADDREQRPRSLSAHDPNRGRLLASEEDLELRRSLYKLYNEA